MHFISIQTFKHLDSKIRDGIKRKETRQGWMDGRMQSRKPAVFFSVCACAYTRMRTRRKIRLACETRKDVAMLITWDGWMEGCCHVDNLRILVINRHKSYNILSQQTK